MSSYSSPVSSNPNAFIDVDRVLAERAKHAPHVDAALAELKQEQAEAPQRQIELQAAQDGTAKLNASLARLEQRPEELQSILNRVENMSHANGKRMDELELALAPLHIRLGRWAARNFRTCASYTAAGFLGGLGGGLASNVIFKSAFVAYIGGFGGAATATGLLYLLRRSCCRTPCT